MQKFRNGALVAVAMLVLGGPAFAAGNNNSPPAGAIFDLGGGETGTAAQAVNHGAAVQESVNFTAGISNTNITFAFREDPAFFSFSNVTLQDITTPGGNLIQNGTFASGTGNNPTDWTDANIYGATYNGVVATDQCTGGLTTCWFDGSVQAYDAITQVVGTTVGDAYTLSFAYTDTGSLTTFSDLSTNGDTTTTLGNGIDILAYAQAGLPVACTPGQVCGGSGTSVPEPASFAMLLAGMIALPFFRRFRSN